jgi:putative NADH-flavin reductase
MTRITVLGGTGYGGSAVVREAARRGHAVTSISRSAPTTAVADVNYETRSVTEPGVVEEAVATSDVVFVALSPRGDMAGRVEGIVDDLIKAAAGRVRVGVLGGASSLLMSPNGPRLYDANPPAPEAADEIHTGLALLDALRAAPAELDWFYLSPPRDFGAWAPAPITGSYRISDDVLLIAEDGTSNISADDLAVAVIDEVENPKHQGRRFHVAH